jgi:hypothetical protein
MEVVAETTLGTTFKSLLLIAAILFLSYSGFAQMVATKDLTNSIPKDTSTEHVPAASSYMRQNTENFTNCGVGIRNGEIVKDVPEKLQLEIVNVEPNLVYDGTTIFVTVRLKNRGDRVILVPWDTPPVKPEIDPKTGFERWEVATIGLKMTKREDDQKYRILKAEANLAATPSNRAQHLALRSGEWVEIKFKATIECFSTESWVCQTLPPGGHTEIQARWSEELSTREVDGCDKWSGHYASAAAESLPFEVVYITSSKSEEATVPQQ